MTCTECERDIELTDVEGHYSGMCQSCRDNYRLMHQLGMDKHGSDVRVMKGYDRKQSKMEYKKGIRTVDDHIEWETVEGKKPTTVFGTFRESLFLSRGARKRGTHRYEDGAD